MDPPLPSAYNEENGLKWYYAFGWKTKKEKNSVFWVMIILGREGQMDISPDEPNPSFLSFASVYWITTYHDQVQRFYILQASSPSSTSGLSL